MRLSRRLFVVLNMYALMLAAIMIWPFLQMLLTSVTSDVVFPPRYFSISASGAASTGEAIFSRCWSVCEWASGRRCC